MSYPYTLIAVAMATGLSAAQAAEFGQVISPTVIYVPTPGYGHCGGLCSA